MRYVLLIMTLFTAKRLIYYIVVAIAKEATACKQGVVLLKGGRKMRESANSTKVATVISQASGTIVPLSPALYNNNLFSHMTA
jgi:hypothetical protein